MDGLFDMGSAARPRAPPGGPPGRWPATRTPRRRWRCGCGRAPSTSWSARSTCWPRARRCAGWSRATSRCRCCCGGRRAPARPRSPRSSPGDQPALRRGVRGRRRASRRCGPPSTAARDQLARGGPETVLFVDEVHRFTKAQQDALLPGRREPLGHAGRGDDREPVLLGDLAAAVAVAAADARAAHRRRHPRRGRRALADERGLGGARRPSTTRRSTTWSGWPAATPAGR